MKAVCDKGMMIKLMVVHRLYEELVLEVGRGQEEVGG
jgi:hypothetical protein